MNEGETFLTTAEEARWPSYAAYIRKVGPESTIRGEIVDWLMSGESEYTIVKVAPDRTTSYTIDSVEQVLCAFYGIDYRAHQRERGEAIQEALERQRFLNERVAKEGR